MSEKSLAISNKSLAVMPAMGIAEAVDRYSAITAFTQRIMKSGIDYGAVPGTDKPTLLKPGAEKLSAFFGLTPAFEPIEIIKDWTGKEHGEPFFEYQYKCRLFRGDRLIAEGIGSCNSWEKKYRYRWVTEEEVPFHLNPNNLLSRKSNLIEFEFAINKRETSGRYGKSAEYWDVFKSAIATGDAIKTTRKTGAGKELDAWMIETTVYRVPNEDIFSQVNTIDKMAQKRALVAAVLIGVNASEFFTQDLEDMDLDTNIVDSVAVQIADDKPKSSAKNKNGSSRNPKSMLDEVNRLTNNHYESTNHLYNTLGGNWPDFGNDEEYKQAINNAVDHANTD